MKIVLFSFFRFTFRCFDRFHMVISIVLHAKTAWQPSMRTISFISFTFSFLRRERIRQNPLNWRRRRWYWWWWWWGHTLWDRYIHTDEFICIKLEWVNLSKCPSFSHIDSNSFRFTFVSRSFFVQLVGVRVCSFCLFRLHHIEMCLRIVWTTNKMIVWWAMRCKWIQFNLLFLQPHDWIHKISTSFLFYCSLCECTWIYVNNTAGNAFKTNRETESQYITKPKLPCKTNFNSNKLHHF